MVKIKYTGGRKPNFMPALDLLPASWRIVHQNFITVAELLLIPLLVSTVAYMLFRTPAEVASLQAAAKDPTMPIHIGPGILASSIASLVASVAIGPPLAYTLIRGAKNKRTDIWPAILATRRFYVRYIGLLLVVTIAFILGALLIVPAFFVLQRFILTPYYLIDRDLSIKQALLTSNNEARQSGWAIWQLLLMIGVIIVIAYTPTIGTIMSLVLGFVFAAAPALRYKELTDAKFS
ncbi:MAG: hypothetical protein JWM37_826 [Candidatus Saccharibacteria bacterium]|nr:hypothetical protein [Candidatus Saccharibacteria bacterium]